MKTIIIDDEKLAIQIVREYLAEEADVEIIGEYQNGFDGLKAINDLKPDLVFLDIQMPKLTGFEMLELIDNPPIIIFTTAYEEYALKAFEKNATDYLLKPFGKNRFIQAVEKARKQFVEPASKQNDYRPLVESVEVFDYPLDRVVVKESGRIFIVPVQEIYFIEAADDYVVINTEKKEYVKNATMKYYEQKLPKANFVRVHRSAIININFIKEIQAYNKETHVVLMKNGKSVKTSRQGSVELKKILKF
jgi:two-component system LytT family response regulator